MLVAADAADLARHLVLQTYPAVEESRERLGRAGWLVQFREEFGSGRKNRVLVSNGQRTVEAEGDNLPEAWYRVAQKVLQEDPPMTSPIPADPVPLRADERGGLRVGDSRILLDLVIEEYHNGVGPEGMVHAYPTLNLADVYAVIAYYLRHRDEVDEFLHRREAEAAALRREIEGQQPGSAELSAKLLARREQQEKDHAAPRS
jgi:uncharacterized protein (DUF433 family)